MAKTISLSILLQFISFFANAQMAIDEALQYEAWRSKYYSIGSFSDGIAVARPKDTFYDTYINVKGEIIDSTQQFREAHSFHNSYAAVNALIKQKWGVIDTNFRQVLPYIFEDISDYSEGLFAVALKPNYSTGMKYGYIDINQEVKIPFQYDFAGKFSAGLARVKKKEKFGFIDKTGKEIISCQFGNVSDFKDEVAAAQNEEGKYGLIDKKGVFIIMPTYNNITFHEGDKVFILEENSKLGMANTKGKIIVPVKFSQYSIKQSATNFIDNIIYLHDNGSPLAFDKNGETVKSYFNSSQANAFGKFDLFFNKIGAFAKNNLTQKVDTFERLTQTQLGFVAKKNEKFALLSKDLTKTLIPYEYDDININYYDDLYVVAKKGNYLEVFDKNYQLIIPAKYKLTKIIAKSFSFLENGKYGYFDFEKTFFAPEYDYITKDPENPNLFFIKKGNLSGLIDKKGVPIIPLKTYPYDLISISKEKIIVWKNQLKGTIDLNGKELVPPIYEDITPYKTLFLARKDNRNLILNPKGQVIVEYDQMQLMEFFITYRDKKNEVGVINLDGKLLIPQGYTFAAALDSLPYAIVSKEAQLNKSKFGVIDVNGKFIFEEKYFFQKKYKEGMMPITDTEKRKTGFLNQKMQVAIPIEYTATSEFNGGIAIASKGENQWGIIDKNGKELVPFEYQGFGTLENEYIIATKNNKYGALNKKLEIIIPLEYNFVEEIDKDLFHVKKDGKSGITNAKNTVIIPIGAFEFDYNRTVTQNGLFNVRKGELKGVINQKQEIVVPIEYEQIEHLSTFLFLLKKNAAWYFYNSKTKDLSVIK